MATCGLFITINILHTSQVSEKRKVIREATANERKGSLQDEVCVNFFLNICALATKDEIEQEQHFINIFFNSDTA